MNDVRVQVDKALLPPAVKKADEKKKKPTSHAPCIYMYIRMFHVFIYVYMYVEINMYVYTCVLGYDLEVRVQ